METELGGEQDNGNNAIKDPHVYRSRSPFPCLHLYAMIILKEVRSVRRGGWSLGVVEWRCTLENGRMRQERRRQKNRYSQDELGCARHRARVRPRIRPQPTDVCESVEPARLGVGASATVSTKKTGCALFLLSEMRLNGNETNKCF